MSQNPSNPAGKSTCERDMVIKNAHGIHARPAALLVKIASQYRAEIMLNKDGISVSAKSIIGVLSIEGQPGSTLNVSAEGDDADDAMDAIEELFENKFNEE